MLEFTVGTEKDKEFRHLRKILVCFNGKMSTVSPQRKSFFPFQVGKENKTLVVCLGECHFIFASDLFYTYWQADLEKQ